MVAKRHEDKLAEIKRRKDFADDEHHRVFRFVGVVSDQSVKTATETLRTWLRLDADLEERPTYEFALFSPGGEVVTGLALHDFVSTELKSTGIKVITHAYGMAASMGSVLLQMGDMRYVSPSCSFLIHEVQASALGSWGEIQDKVKWIELMQERLFSILAERSKLTKRQIQARAKRTDWWMLGPEVVKLGFADEVR